MVGSINSSHFSNHQTYVKLTDAAEWPENTRLISRFNALHKKVSGVFLSSVFTACLHFPNSTSINQLISIPLKIGNKK